MQEFSNNEKLKNELLKLISTNHMVHAMLFIGSSQDARHEFGMWLSEKLLCKTDEEKIAFSHGNCADFILLKKPEDREIILKEQILSLIENLSYKPFGDKYVILIEDANLMRPEAQNKLLKTLEEPTSPAIFILLSENIESILPTVRSRCSCYYLEEDKVEYPDETKKLCDSFCRLIVSGSYYFEKKNLLLDMLKEKDDLKENALLFLDCLEESLEEYILKGEVRACEGVKHVEAARKYIKQGQSAAYSLKQMCLRV